jgi:uncharacterized protein
MKIIKKIMIKGIKWYQKAISPYKGFKCPYYPSCSSYGLKAVEEYGPLKGGLLALWRILRCNPFSHGGYDPVPERNKKNTRSKHQRIKP